VTLQYAVWDRFKVLPSLTPSNRVNLRHLCLHLITKKALSISLLKVNPYTLFMCAGVGDGGSV
jgi:hypothetical protein